MPVKDGLYDMLGNSRQIAEIKRSYKEKAATDKKETTDKKEATDEGEITVENGVLKVKLTGEDLMSGLKRDDKLIPIITAVVYFGEKP